MYPSSPRTNRIALLPENFLVSESAQPISRRDFLSVLANVTGVMVRGSYSTEPSAVYRYKHTRVMHFNTFSHLHCWALLDVNNRKSGVVDIVMDCIFSIVFSIIFLPSNSNKSSDVIRYNSNCRYCPITYVLLCKYFNLWETVGRFFAP